MKVSINGNYLIREILGKKVLIGSGKQFDFSKMLIINDTATYIIQKIQEGNKTSKELADLLTEDYEVSYETALKDIEETLLQLRNLNVIAIDKD